eukprot:5634827-Alexandrium_andersonii.AAC.1
MVRRLQPSPGSGLPRARALRRSKGLTRCLGEGGACARRPATVTGENGAGDLAIELIRKGSPTRHRRRGCRYRGRSRARRDGPARGRHRSRASPRLWHGRWRCRSCMG